jgi:exopolysaccharide biosynthesis polyprenyl glycosylphosphotransferase
MYLPEKNVGKTRIDRVISSIIAIAMIQFATVSTTFFVREFAFPRTIFLISFGIHCVVMVLWGYLLDVINERYSVSNRVLLVGGEETNRKVAETLLGFRGNKVQIAGKIESVVDLKEEHLDKIDSFCLTSDLKGRDRETMIEIAVSKGKAIYIIPHFHEIILNSSIWSQFDDTPVLKVRKLSLSMEQRFAKRVFDLVATVPILLLAIPFMGIAAVLIKMNDKGPVFYAQERLTIDGRPLELIKFRTMIVDAEENSGPILAFAGDERITKIGRILRKTRLDELPQLFNVIKGDLSLVGPRPERKFFYEEYESEVPQFKYRLSVKAGITGLGQIHGKYTTSPKDKLTYDLMYIYDYSLLLDIKILLKTIRIVFTKSSSDGVS